MTAQVIQRDRLGVLTKIGQGGQGAEIDVGARRGFVLLEDHRGRELGFDVGGGIDHALAALPDLGQHPQPVALDHLRCHGS
ncbi:hypothetical protein, partial [Mycobacterium alsense]|uniref:hypothetical protein n=1 Tax=Mycobacterium alsense TaxID=324058 RepID=UPI001041E49B